MVGSKRVVRVTDGKLVVENDALRIDRTPLKFLKGQASVVKHGDDADRLRALGSFAGLVLLPVLVYVNALVFAENPTTLDGRWSALTVTVVLAGLSLNYLLQSVVPTAAIEEISLVRDDRELTIRYRGDRAALRVPVLGRVNALHGVKRYLPFSWVGSDVTETTFRLRSDEDVRAATRAFQLTGLGDVFEASDQPSEERRTFRRERVTVDRGVVFCGRCESQVSPSDDTCPSCDYSLRVTESDADAEETAVSTVTTS